VGVGGRGGRGGGGLGACTAQTFFSRVAGGVCPIGVEFGVGGAWFAVRVFVLVCVEPRALCAAWLQDFYAVVNRAELERCEREGVEPDRARMRRNLTVGADNLLGLFA
jgi:hypothetical protein